MARACMQVGVRGIQALSAMQRLSHLNLFSCHFGDEGAQASVEVKINVMRLNQAKTCFF